MSDGATFGGLMAVLVILGVVVAVLWVFLPFAVFGVKNLLRDAIAQQRRTNELLERLAKPAESKAAFQDTKPGRRTP